MKKTTETSSAIAQESNLQTEKQKGKKRKVFVIALILILILVIGAMAAVIIKLLKASDQSGTDTQVSSNPKRDTVVTMENKDEIQADLDNKVAEGMFEVKMNVDWTFKDSSTPSEDAYVANPLNNSNTVYFDVTLDSTGETVYESPYIPVGSALTNIALKKELAAGKYPATLTYYLIDENYNDVSNLAVAVTLNIEN